MKADGVHCGNCKWTMKQALRGPGGEIQIGKDVLTCHRFPPSAVMVQTGPGSMILTANFPPVNSDMVCSLHEFEDPDGAMLTANVPGRLGPADQE